MAYVGTPLDTTNAFQSLAGKRFSGDASTTDFTLDSSPNSTLDIEVFVENVRQDPNSAYTVSGTTLGFTAAPPSGTNNVYVVHQAKAVGTIDPAVGSTLDLNGAAELILDADADTAISADAADDQIDIKIGGNDDFKITAKTLSIGGAAAADSKIVFDGNAQDYHIGLDDSADDLVIGKGSALGTTTSVAIDENGIVRMPLQCSFSAYNNGGQANKTGDDTMYTVLFDTERFDLNGDFASSTFTAPVTGKYLLSAHIGLTGYTTSSTYSNMYLVTSNDTYAEFAGTEVENNQFFSYSIVADMDASDTAIVRVNAGGEGSKVVDVADGADGTCFFSGCLLA